MRECGKCGFWHEQSDPQAEYKMGQCRRKSPKIIGKPEDHEPDTVWLETYWPVTNADEWCGKFELKEDEGRA